jgi:hypothetical protein
VKAVFLSRKPVRELTLPEICTVADLRISGVSVGHPSISLCQQHYEPRHRLILSYALDIPNETFDSLCMTRVDCLVLVVMMLVVSKIEAIFL